MNMVRCDKLYKWCDTLWWCHGSDIVAMLPRGASMKWIGVMVVTSWQCCHMGVALG